MDIFLFLSGIGVAYLLISLGNGLEAYLKKRK